MFGSVAVHLRYALIIVLVVVVIILLSKWTGSGRQTNTAIVVSGGNGSKQTSRLHTASSASSQASVQQVMKETQEWAAEADKDDVSPIGQLVNATYAVAYAQAAQAFVPAAEIKQASQVEVEPLVARMKAKQAESVQFLAHHYPSIL